MKNLDFLLKPLIAHRGFFDNEKGIPENSILAFARAIDSNYSIELDVHLLNDNKIIVFHDDNLKRMTGIDKLVKDCTYEEIRNLKLLDTNEKIPLLEEVLNFVNGKVALLIELKYDVKTGLLEKELMELLINYSGKYAVQSFHPMAILWLKKHAPEVVRGQLAKEFKNQKYGKLKNYILSNMLLNKLTKPDFVSYDIKSVDKILDKISKSMVLLGWTVRDKKSYEKYVKICNNLICENFKFI